MKTTKKPGARRHAPQPKRGKRLPASTKRGQGRRTQTPRAREPAPPVDAATDEQIRAAQTFEDRGLMCLRFLSAGQWNAATVSRLMRVWGATEAALSNYRRSGKVALAAVSGEDHARRLDHVLASLQLQADENEALAKSYEARGRLTLAAKHRDLQRRATMSFAEIAGLNERRMSVSIEADPRVAGLYQAILGALEDRDRQEAERARELAEWIAEVSKLTGGVLPHGLPAALPSVRDHVRDAVKRYEAEIGARSAPRLAA